MSIKVELREQLQEFGYELGPFTSKETLSVILSLHSLVFKTKDINVANLNDLDLRKTLIQHGFIVGPITNHTRVIYQRKLLEVLARETRAGSSDEAESNESIDEGEDSGDENNSLYPNIREFKKPEPIVIRHDYKSDNSKRNTYEESNAIRTRVPPKSDEVKNDFASREVHDRSETEKNELKISKKDGGTVFYTGITIMVALIIFVLYLWFEK